MSGDHNMNCSANDIELNDGGFPVKNANYWKRQYDKLKKEQEGLLDARSYMLGYMDGKEGLEAKVRGEK
jgi:hypothetical protein